MTNGRLEISDYVSAIVGSVLAVTCALLAFSGVIPWWLAAIFTPAGLALTFAVFVGASRPYTEQLEITERGVTRHFGRKFRAKRQESVSWENLSKIEIETTDEGPFAEDFFYMLYDKAGDGVVVGNRLAVAYNLLGELKQRLPDIDHKTVLDASGCTENRSFLIWPGRL
jgi:hypothetical protein